MPASTDSSPESPVISPVQLHLSPAALTAEQRSQLPAYQPPQDWTHWLMVDNGLAALLARTGNTHPAQLTPEDFTALAEHFVVTLTRDPNLANNWAMNLVGQAKEDVTTVLIRHLSRRHPKSHGLRCSCCGQEAALLADRRFLPMGNAENCINQGPAALPGVPMCHACALLSAGICVLLPFLNNRWLLVDAEPHVMLPLIRELLPDAELIRQTRQLGVPFKAAGNARWLIDLVARLRDVQAIFPSGETPAQPGALEFTELQAELLFVSPIGKDPKVTPLPLTARLTQFIYDLRSSQFAGLWMDLYRSASDVGAPTFGRGSLTPPEGDKKSPTGLPEQIFASLVGGQQSASEAVRMVQLVMLRHARPQGPAVISAAWEMCRYYLEEVLYMNQDRLNSLVGLAERIVTLLEEDSRKYVELFGPRLGEIRVNLVNLNRDRVRRGHQPLITSVQDWLHLTELNAQFVPIGFPEAWQLVSIYVHAQAHRWNPKSKVKTTAVERGVRDLALTDDTRSETMLNAPTTRGESL